MKNNKLKAIIIIYIFIGFLHSIINLIGIYVTKYNQNRELSILFIVLYVVSLIISSYILVRHSCNKKYLIIACIFTMGVPFSNLIVESIIRFKRADMFFFNISPIITIAILLLSTYMGVKNIHIGRLFEKNK
ncbi:hypothetical protein [Senegalia massiliensis]|uniref:Uncharacterized protein n=1 Tax=Senegalia massiliensis TaxID=1720316 RepID=A0A845QZH5_9CLOT|nr:hypothetical protein [Senegalia massiliensis]NBI07570.1 hypothetical protein [Senegalia massiliensis]